VEVIVQISWFRLEGELQEILTLHIILQKVRTTEMSKWHTF